MENPKLDLLYLQSHVCVRLQSHCAELIVPLIRNPKCGVPIDFIMTDHFKCNVQKYVRSVSRKTNHKCNVELQYPLAKLFF